MPPELTALACAVLIQSLTIGAYSVVGNLELGPRVTTGPRDGKLPPISVRLGRLMRAVTNGFEGLVMFAPAALIIAISGQSTPITAVAAWVYVAARILYVPAYAFGWRPWRSAIWGIGFLATLTMIVASLI